MQAVAAATVLPLHPSMFAMGSVEAPRVLIGHTLTKAVGELPAAPPGELWDEEIEQSAAGQPYVASATASTYVTPAVQSNDVLYETAEKKVVVARVVNGEVESSKFLEDKLAASTHDPSVALPTHRHLDDGRPTATPPPAAGI